MQQLKEQILSKGGLTALGSGIALIGSYFLYKNIKESINIDRIASKIEIDQEIFQQSGFIGRKQLLQILSESQELVADLIKEKELKLQKQGINHLKQKEYLEYADMLLDCESFKVQKQVEALKQLREHLGISEEIFNHNLQQQHKSSQIQNINFVEEYKEAMNSKQLMIYQDLVANTPLQNMDFLSFKYLLEEHLINILQKNEKIFDIVIKRITDQSPQIDLLYPCMETLAYHLFFISTNYTQNEVKQAEMNFKRIFEQSSQENSQLLKDQLNKCFKQLENSIVEFLQVKHKNDIANMGRNL